MMWWLIGAAVFILAVIIGVLLANALVRAAEQCDPHRETLATPDRDHD